MAEKTALSPLGKAALGLGAAGVGLSIARGMKDTGATTRRQQQLMAQRRSDLSAPMYDPGVRLASLQKEAAEEPPPPFGAQVADRAKGVLLGGAERALGHLMAMPAQYALSQAKKHFVTGPKHQAAFDAAISNDPDLQRAHAENPGVLLAAHETLKKFAPTVATDPNAVRAYLGHSVATRGAVDFATLKMLAETEKLHREGSKLR